MKNQMSRKNINIVLAEDEYELLRNIAHKQYRSVKACVEMLTHEYIKVKRNENDEPLVTNIFEVSKRL